LLFFLTAHWRKPIDFSRETMAAAKAQADSFRNLSVAIVAGGTPHHEWSRVAEALDDDFNTPAVLAVLHDWRSRGHISLVTKGLDLFGLGSLTSQKTAPPEILELRDRRDAARGLRNFSEADRLRIEIESAGWDVRDDIPGGQSQVIPRS
jgi:cysteinyl-tRNA synthetase